LANNVRIIRGEFINAYATEAAEILAQRGRESLPPGQKLDVNCSALGRSPVTFQWADRSLRAVADEIASRTGLILRFSDDTLHLELPGHVSPIKRRDRPAAANDVHEVALRYLLAFHDERPASAQFLSIDGADPAKAFLTRFKPPGPQAKSHAGSRRPTDAIFYDLTQFKWTGDSTAVITTDTSGGGTGVGRTFELTHTTKGWFVTKVTHDWSGG
jgi:hypothetical protein